MRYNEVFKTVEFEHYEFAKEFFDACVDASYKGNYGRLKQEVMTEVCDNYAKYEINDELICYADYIACHECDAEDEEILCCYYAAALLLDFAKYENGVITETLPPVEW